MTHGRDDIGSLAGLRARARAWLRASASETVACGGGRAKRPRVRASVPATKGCPDPYWTELPVALARRAGRHRAGWLEDVLWGQFCLFLFVRLQDDVFDSQAEDRRLIYVADRCLIEAERALGRHFARSSGFWRIFHDCLDRSTRAILDVDELQKQPRGRPGALRAQYARVADVFKVGVAATCIKLGRTRQLRSLFRYADEMAMAGQIVDDLEDVAEDLGHGRFNFAAKTLLQGRSLAPRKAALAIAREILRNDGAHRVLAAARLRLRRAEGAARSLELPLAVARVSRSKAEIDRADRAMHEKAVELAFGAAR